MLSINDVLEDYSVRKEMMLLPGFAGDTEMSEHDSAFLCGLLNKVRPRKILEVGVAGGGDNCHYFEVFGGTRRVLSDVLH